jgi:hypothetical protein
LTLFLAESEDTALTRTTIKSKNRKKTVPETTIEPGHRCIEFPRGRRNIAPISTAKLGGFWWLETMNAKNRTRVFETLRSTDDGSAGSRPDTFPVARLKSRSFWVCCKTKGAPDGTPLAFSDRDIGERTRQ